MPLTSVLGRKLRAALAENAKARRFLPISRLGDLVAPAGPTPAAPARVRFAFHKNSRWLIGRPHQAAWVERRGFPMAEADVFGEHLFLCPRCLTGFDKWSEVIEHAKLGEGEGEGEEGERGGSKTASGCDCHDLLNPRDEDGRYKLETQKDKRRRWKLPARLR